MIEALIGSAIGVSAVVALVWAIEYFYERAEADDDL